MNNFAFIPSQDFSTLGSLKCTLSLFIAKTLKEKLQEPLAMFCIRADCWLKANSKLVDKNKTEYYLVQPCPGCKWDKDENSNIKWPLQVIQGTLRNDMEP